MVGAQPWCVGHPRLIQSYRRLPCASYRFLLRPATRACRPASAHRTFYSCAPRATLAFFFSSSLSFLSVVFRFRRVRRLEANNALFKSIISFSKRAVCKNERKYHENTNISVPDTEGQEHMNLRHGKKLFFLRDVSESRKCILGSERFFFKWRASLSDWKVFS